MRMLFGRHDEINSIIMRHGRTCAMDTISDSDVYYNLLLLFIFIITIIIVITTTSVAILFSIITVSL